MKKFKRVMAALLTVCLLAGAVVASPAANATVKAQETVSLNKTRVNLVVGKSTTLRLKNAKGTVAWSSGNSKVATVNSKGKVTAKKFGIVDITAQYKGESYKCRVYIRDNKLDVQKSSVKVKVGKTVSVKITVKVNNDILLYNSNKKVAVCKWSKKWKKNVTTLKITGKSVGKTRVLIYDKNRYFMLTVNVTK